MSLRIASNSITSSAGSISAASSIKSESVKNTRILKIDEKERLRVLLEKKFSYNSGLGYFHSVNKSFLSFLAESCSSLGGQFRIYLKGGGARHVRFNTPLTGKDLDFSIAVDDVQDKKDWERTYGEKFVRPIATRFGGKNVLAAGLKGKVFDPSARSLLLQLPIEIEGSAKSVDLDFAAVKGLHEFKRPHSCDSSHGSYYIDITPILSGNWQEEVCIVGIDGYDLEKSEDLTAQRRFYIRPGAGKTLFQGIRKYCDHLTKGLIADSNLMGIPQTESDLCDWISKFLLGAEKELGLDGYLKDHYEGDIPSQILFLLNYHDIFLRSGKPFPKIEQFIFSHLSKILGLDGVPPKPAELVKLCKAFLYLSYSSEVQSETFSIAPNRKGYFLFCEDKVGARKKRGLVVETSLSAVIKIIGECDESISKTPFLANFVKQFSQNPDLLSYCRKEITSRQAFINRQQRGSVSSFLSTREDFIKNYSEMTKHFSLEEIGRQLQALIASPNFLKDINSEEETSLRGHISHLFSSLLNMKNKNSFFIGNIFNNLLAHNCLLTSEQKEFFAPRIMQSLVAQKDKQKGFHQAVLSYELLFFGKIEEGLAVRLAEICIKSLEGVNAQDVIRLQTIVQQVENGKLIPRFREAVLQYHPQLLGACGAPASSEPESKSNKPDLLESILKRVSALTSSLIDNLSPPEESLNDIMREALHLIPSESNALQAFLVEQEKHLLEASKKRSSIKPHLESMVDLHLGWLRSYCRNATTEEQVLPVFLERGYILMQVAFVGGDISEKTFLKHWNAFFPLMFASASSLRMTFLQEVYKFISFNKAPTKEKMQISYVKQITQLLSDSSYDSLDKAFPIYEMVFEILLAINKDSQDLQSRAAMVEMISKFLNNTSKADFNQFLGRVGVKRNVFIERIKSLHSSLSNDDRRKLDLAIQKHSYFKFYEAAKRGIAAYDSEDWKGAAQHLEAASKIQLEFVDFLELDVWNRLTLCYSNLKQNDKALQRAKQAIQKIKPIKGNAEWNNTFSLNFENAGRICMNMEEGTQAVEFFLKAKGLNPTKHNLLKRLAHAYYLKEDERRAVIYFKMFLEKVLNDVPAWICLANTHLSLKEYKEAIVAFDQAQKFPLDEEALLQIAKHETMAVEGVISKTPHDKDIWWLLGDYFNRKQKLALAQESLMLCLMLDPDHSKAKELLFKIDPLSQPSQITEVDFSGKIEQGNLVFKQQKWRDAIPLYESALESADCPRDVWNNLGLAYVKDDRGDAAANTWLRGHLRYPNYLYILVNLAAIYELNKQQEKVMLCLEKILSLDPSDSTTLQKLIEIYHALYEKNKYPEYLRKREALSADFKKKFSDKTHFLAKFEKKDEPVESKEKATYDKEQFAKALKMGQLAGETEDYPRRAKYLQIAVDLNPAGCTPQNWIDLSRDYSVCRNNKMALATAIRAQKQYPLDTEVLINMVAIFTRAEKKEALIKVLKSIKDPIADVYEQLCLAYFNLNKINDAFETAREGLAKYPENILLQSQFKICSDALTEKK